MTRGKNLGGARSSRANISKRKGSGLTVRHCPSGGEDRITARKSTDDKPVYDKERGGRRASKVPATSRSLEGTRPQEKRRAFLNKKRSEFGLPEYQLSRQGEYRMDLSVGEKPSTIESVFAEDREESMKGNRQKVLTLRHRSAGYYQRGKKREERPTSGYLLWSEDIRKTRKVKKSLHHYRSHSATGFCVLEVWEIRAHTTKKKRGGLSERGRKREKKTCMSRTFAPFTASQRWSRGRAGKASTRHRGERRSTRRTQGRQGSGHQQPTQPPPHQTPDPEG